MTDNNPLSIARVLLEDGQLDSCLNLIKTHWLSNLSDPEASALCGDLMAEAGHPELADKLHALSEKAKELSVNPLIKDGSQEESKALFEAGYGLIDVRQYELAAMLLTRCTALAPNEPVACYELGFSLMSLGRCREAVGYFEKALTYADDFDTRLNLAVCHTLLRETDRAKEMVERMAKLAEGEEETKELNHRRQVLKRMDSLKGRTSFNSRDWMYVLYGSIVLRPSEAAAPAKEDLTSVAAMLATLKGFLEGLPAEIEAIEFYSPKSKAMAKALAEFMELPLDSYRGPVRPDKALLVMAWATDIIGPHQAFLANSLNRNIFAYAMSAREPLPICPDLVGCFKEEADLGYADGAAESAAAKLLERARNMESNPDIIRAVRDAVEYYSDKRDLIVISNPGHFSERPEFTAEIRV